MTIADQIKVLCRKIQQNEAQYDLDREAAKISAFSWNNLDKYEYLTGEDLDYKPSVIEQARLENSPLGKVFNKELKEEDEKGGLLKRRKNSEDKIEKQLKTIKSKNDTKSQIDWFNEELSSEAVAWLKEIKQIGDNVDYRKLFSWVVTKQLRF